MSKRGFVYCLSNEYMPHTYKVGCTERAPSERAAELSNATGVPAAFEVLCYIEVDNFQEVERALHSWMSAFRISQSREFFHGEEGCIRGIARWMWRYPTRLSFCDASEDRDCYSKLVHDLLGCKHFTALPSPWKPDEPEDDDIPADETEAQSDLPALKLVSVGDAP